MGKDSSKISNTKVKIRKKFKKLLKASLKSLDNQCLSNSLIIEKVKSSITNLKIPINLVNISELKYNIKKIECKNGIISVFNKKDDELR